MTFAGFETEIGLDIVALISAIVLVTGILYRKIFRPTYLKIVQIADSTDKIDFIHKQMFTNGGKTLKDQLNRIEKQVKVVDAKQALSMKDTKQAVFESDEKGFYIFVNRTYCRWLSVSESEAEGNGWINHIADHDKKRVLSAWKYAIVDGIEFAMEYDMVDSNGVIFKVKGKANPLRTAEGTILGFLGLIEKKIT
jgi:PAS domain S-box-containing protein